MNYKLQINNQFLRIITNTSIIDVLEHNEINASEGKTLDGDYLTIIRFSAFNKSEIIKKVKKILKEGK